MRRSAVLVVIGSVFLAACGGQAAVAPPALAPTSVAAPTQAPATPASKPTVATAPAPTSATTPAPAASGAPDVAKRKAEAQARGMLYVTRDEILAGAEKEGEIIVSPGFEETVDPYKKAFTAAYPMIKNFTWRVVTGNAAGERFTAELIAGRSDVDVFDIRTEYRADLEKNNVFARYDLKSMAEDGQLKLPAGIVDEGGWSTWNSNRVYAIAYNTDLVSEADAPKNWESCLDPRWSGKSFVDTKATAFAALYTAWGEQRVLDYARKLKENTPIFFRGGTAGLTRMISGEASIFCGTQTNSVYRILLDDPKAPVKLVATDPLPVEVGENEGISVKATHPNAALLGLEFLATPQAVQLLDKIDPGVASIFVEGTKTKLLSSELEAKGGKVAYCNAACSSYLNTISPKIAVESWGFPKVGYDPGS
jgi:ABC-type Fe3+ transport system substrate-binding protein